MKINLTVSETAKLIAALLLSTLAVLAIAAEPEAPRGPANLQISRSIKSSADLSFELNQVVRLHEAGVGERVLTAYVENSKNLVAPKAEEIVYLRDRGISENIIVAALQKAPRPAEPPAVASTTSAPAPAATPVTSSGSYIIPATQPTVVYTQAATVYVQPPPVYVTPPAVSYGYSDYGYCSPFPYRPYYYAQRYNYSHFPRVYPGYAGVSLNFRFGGGYHHRW